jgi:hypothetical protein
VGALATAWQVRTPAQQQIDLTQQGVEGATTVNSTILAAAEADATGVFFNLTGVSLDTTQADHLAVACLGVTYFLLAYQGLPRSGPAESARETWERACNRLARTNGALVWLLPQTNSNMSPTADEPGALPDFDRGRLGDLVPRPPLSGPSDTSPNDFGRGAGSP